MYKKIYKFALNCFKYTQSTGTLKPLSPTSFHNSLQHYVWQVVVLFLDPDSAAHEYVFKTDSNTTKMSLMCNKYFFFEMKEIDT